MGHCNDNQSDWKLEMTPEGQRPVRRTVTVILADGGGSCERSIQTLVHAARQSGATEAFAASSLSDAGLRQLVRSLAVFPVKKEI